MTLQDLVQMRPRELREVLEGGHPVALSSLHDVEYHGVSLGQPRVITALTWTKFKKVFQKTADGRIRGWNVSVEQTPLGEPWVDRLKRGERMTYGYYGVREAHHYPEVPERQRQGLVIDYGLEEWGPMKWLGLRDPLVAVNEGSDELLLGYTYATLAGRAVQTPTFFSLSRGGELRYSA